MPVLHLKPNDVTNIKESWTSVEQQLVEVGIRVFISLLENQPNIKRTFRKYRSKRHSELRINEDLQKLILYLICGLKRVVKYLNDNKSMGKYLRRIVKKLSPTEIDFARINPAELSSVFCSAIKDIITSNRIASTKLQSVSETSSPECTSPAACWTIEVEDSWTALFGSLINATRTMAKPRMASHASRDRLVFKEPGVHSSDDEEEDGIGSEDGTSSNSSSHKHTSFDRHLVLVGCQTFQEFFDRHPEVLSHFDKFDAIEIDAVRVSDALRMHASRVLAIVEDIVDNTGNPDKIRKLMQDLGRNHYKQGITQEHLDMLGPIICQTIRPLVFKAGLWTIEVEKSWTHLFDMVATLMKRGYPGGTEECNRSKIYGPTFFPTLTHTLILKDTWVLIVEQMHELGLDTFLKLFRLSANLRYYYPKHNRPDTPEGLQDNINRHFECLVAVIDDVVRSLPDISSHFSFLKKLGTMHADVNIQERLLELMGPVFCNTVRPLLLVQGKWSFKVETAWLLLFRHIASFMHIGYKPPIDQEAIERSALSPGSLSPPPLSPSPSILATEISSKEMRKSPRVKDKPDSRKKCEEEEDLRRRHRRVGRSSRSLSVDSSKSL